jgi:hypothetical protein
MNTDEDGYARMNADLRVGKAYNHLLTWLQ